MLTVVGGNAWRSQNYTDNGKYLVVTIANVKGGYFIDDKFGHRINVDNPSIYLLRENDILVSLTGNVGRVSKMTQKPAVLNQRVAKIVIDNSITENEYVYHVLSFYRFEDAMVNSGQGAAQSNISNNDIKEYRASMPKNFSEQVMVGTYFKNLDHLITLHQREHFLSTSQFFSGRRCYCIFIHWKNASVCLFSFPSISECKSLWDIRHSFCKSFSKVDPADTLFANNSTSEDNDG